jgi:AcrR family transcriptional regulator
MRKRLAQDKKGKRPTISTRAARDKLFDIASDLFYNQSIRGVGVETIVQKAGVAKITLYRNFASKDDLIVAYLQNRNAAYWHIVDEIFAEHEGDPRRQLRALIAYVADRAITKGYRGCPFINYAAEFPEKDHPGHNVVHVNKQEMRRRLTSLASAMNASRPDQLADALFLLVEGAYASSQTLGGRNGPSKSLAQAAEDLIESHLGA